MLPTLSQKIREPHSVDAAEALACKLQQSSNFCVEFATEKESMKQSNAQTKKEKQHRCSDDQNDRTYKQKKKGKMKANDNRLT